MALIHKITAILDSMLDDQTNKQKLMQVKGDEEIKFIFSAWFMFATMWAFGGIIGDDKDLVNKKEFNAKMKEIIKPKIPDDG